MTSRLSNIVLERGEERFTRDMEGLSSAERREIFESLAVPRARATASARQRTERRIRMAWARLQDGVDAEIVEQLVRSWLQRHGMPMIRDFLDRAGVEHAEGYLRREDALERLSADTARAALQEIAHQHDPSDVRLYAALMDLPDVDAPA